MATWKKYLLLQVPGWALTAFLLLGLSVWMGLPPLAASGIFLVWVIKDFVLYPFVRTAYESKVKTGAEQLVGATAVAKEWLNPCGYVQVRGELWRAEAEPSGEPIPPHSAVEVLGARGLTLIVTRNAG